MPDTAWRMLAGCCEGQAALRGAGRRLCPLEAGNNIPQGYFISYLLGGGLCVPRGVGSEAAGRSAEPAAAPRARAPLQSKPSAVDAEVREKVRALNLLLSTGKLRADLSSCL